ncbi:hypothetical protein PIB30_055567 [Stylosanthes scabra]|uniref:Uncharacterized protein n=1 Tax=Stylosanthes scabra TaxID=79078 RepID=A0ABU6YHP4_9FABA|nr:hypothetical protein [Stylosanthes scabra]
MPNHSHSSPSSLQHETQPETETSNSSEQRQQRRSDAPWAYDDSLASEENEWNNGVMLKVLGHVVISAEREAFVWKEKEQRKRRRCFHMQLLTLHGGPVYASFDALRSTSSTSITFSGSKSSEGSKCLLK